MIEKVNPKHPDKIADRIAGAIVDLAYENNEHTKIAVEVLIGHAHCYVMELDPRYIDVIIDRWEKLTGQTAELLS